MEKEETQVVEKLQLDEYKSMETRLYGELIKSCRRYSNKLSIISIVGILDLVKQELMDLDKENLRFMREDALEEWIDPSFIKIFTNSFFISKKDMSGEMTIM